MNKTTQKGKMATEQTTIRDSANKKKIIIGIILMLIAPLVLPILAFLQPLLCDKDSFGQCSIGSDVVAYIFGTSLPLIFFAIGLILVIVGAIQARKK
jgi:thiol:disulfide interchange protein